MPDQPGEKTHDPTPHRREEARKQGQVATSQDLGSAALLVVGMLVLMILGGALIDALARVIQRNLGGDAWLAADVDFFLAHWNGTVWQLMKALIPILGLLLLTGVLVNVFQVGFLFVPQRIAPDLSRINPLKGLQRLFSLTSAMRLSFGLFKVVVIGAVTMLTLYSQWAEILGISKLAAGEIAQFVTDTALWTSLKIGIALVILALLDFAYQRWKHERDLRMTHHELREELKNFQGDPQIVARRRAVQRQLVLNRLSELVPKADVVITNPTELAVAIQYEPEQMAAPVVVAKGAGVIAQRIRRLALEHNVPIVEKKPLAQSLYRKVEINHPIPDKMYAAVAEVLAYVYRLKGKEMPNRPDRAA